MRYSYHIISSIILTLLLVGCNSDALTTPIGSARDAYIPFVESVDTPEAVTTGNRFHVYANVSALANPMILNGLVKTSEEAFGYDPLGFYYAIVPGQIESKKRIHIYLWVVEPLRTGDPVNRLDLLFDSLPAGEYIFQFESAPSASEGGMLHNFITGDSYGPQGNVLGSPTPGAVFYELPLTVLPTAE